MSMLSKFLFGKKADPMGAANQYLSQIPGVGKQYYDPYISRGLDAGGKAQTEYDKLMSDPSGFINALMGSYEPSKGYQFQKDLLTKEMSNTAAAGGIAGTPLDQMTQAEGVQGLLSKDMQQFLQNVLGVYGTGLSGEQGLYDTGFQASGNLADLIGSSLNQQGGLAFQSAQQRNKDRMDKMKMLAQALGGVGGFATGGTGSLFGQKLWGG